VLAPSLWGRRLVWTRIPAWGYINWSEFRRYVYQKYGPKYANMQYNYARKYVEFLENPSKIDTIPSTNRTNVLRALVCLSKFLGKYTEFKNKMKNYGIKWSNGNSMDSFLAILRRDHSNLMDWYKNASNVLKDNERLYLEFMLLTGLRMSEGIKSFNKIIELHKQNKLNDYYNEELHTLEHFKYPREFLRNSKNVYISIIPKELLLRIAISRPVSYITIRKRLKHNGLKVRIKELRQFYGSFLIRHGLIREEVDLLQGRVPRSIFVRHYLTIDFKELVERTLKALEQLKL